MSTKKNKINENCKRAIEAADHEKKAKALRRAEIKFWEEIKDRLEEIKIEYRLSDTWDKICRTYEADNEEDIKKLSSEEIYNMGVRPLNLNQIRYKTPEIDYTDDEYIKINQMNFEYNKHEPILSIDPISFNSNTINAIIGKNGSGKTTFARCFCGLHKKMKGSIMINDKKMNHKERLKECFMVMQDVNHQLFTESVLDELYLSMGEEEVDHAEKILESLDLLEFKDEHPMSLSGGQKQRVAIGCAIASNSNIIFFDEPTSGLDLKHMHYVGNNILKLQEMGKTQFIITHDLEFILNCCTNVVHLDDGRIIDYYPIKGNENKLFDFFTKHIT